MTGGEHCVKIQVPSSNGLENFGVLKIWRKRSAHLISYSVNHKGVCITALATPGLLKIQYICLLLLGSTI